MRSHEKPSAVYSSEGLLVLAVLAVTYAAFASVLLGLLP
jgi:hypothetical protein